MKVRIEATRPDHTFSFEADSADHPSRAALEGIGYETRVIAQVVPEDRYVSAFGGVYMAHGVPTWRESEPTEPTYPLPGAGGPACWRCGWRYWAYRAAKRARHVDARCLHCRVVEGPIPVPDVEALKHSCGGARMRSEAHARFLAGEP